MDVYFYNEKVGLVFSLLSSSSKIVSKDQGKNEKDQGKLKLPSY